jgi:CheY-like chemotaxis protein
MPGPLKSADLAKKAKQRLPDIGVLFTSGYTENSIVHGGRLDPGVQLLSKPYSREQLARKIRHALDSRESPNSPSTESAAPEDGGMPNKAGGLSILVVEDEILIRMPTVEMLAEQGHSTREAGFAEEARRLLEEEAPNLVLTDFGLPGMSGEAFCQEVRRRGPEICLVFATGMNQGPDLDDRSRTSLLQKPFGVDDLRKALEQATAEE